MNKKMVPFGRDYPEWRRTTKNHGIRVYLGEDSWTARNRYIDIATNWGKEENLYIALCLVVPRGTDPREFQYPVKNHEVLLVECGQNLESVYFKGQQHVEFLDECIWSLLRDGARLVSTVNRFGRSEIYRRE